MSSLHPQISALFPPNVKGAELSRPELAEPLFPEEEAAIARAVEKRRLEFALGRTAARRALAALGVPTGALLSQADRSVAWPEVAWGSITHTEGLCAAVAVRRAEFAGIGIDAELANRVQPHLWDMIATAPELAWISAPRDPDARVVRAALLFSAKETFYKAQFCVSRAWVGFHDAETEFDEEGAFRIRLLIDVKDAFARGASFVGKYTQLDRHVVTGMVIAPR